MKILQIISGKEVNGAVVHCKLLVCQLAARGHNVTVMCRPDSWIWDHLDKPRVRCVVSEMNRFPLRELRQAADWVRSEQFDVMHTHMSRAHAYGVLLRRLSGVPVVATAHNRYPQLHWWLNDRVIANSEATRRFHRRINRVDPKRMDTIHCFVDLSRFQNLSTRSATWLRQHWQRRSDQPVIGVVGDVTPRKGHKYLFRSLPGLVNKYPGFKLMVIGRYHRSESYTKRLRRYLLRNGLSGRVRWTGRRNDIPEIMAALDLLVVPSIEEPMGMAPLEAMAAGTPVIASRTGGLVEVVRHEFNGLLFPTKNPRAIELAVTRVLNDSNLRQRFIDNGLRWVHEKFSPQVLSHEIERALQRTSQMKRAA